MVKVGIIGAGRIGKVHVESICTQVANAEVKILADPFMSEETEKWAKNMGVRAVTKDYKEVLADPEIDAVLFIYRYPFSDFSRGHQSRKACIL